MAIEGSIHEDSRLIKKSDLEPTRDLFFTSNVIQAGKLKVKHSLMDGVMIILGFVIYDAYFDQVKFLIKGNKISYLDQYGNYDSKNEIIYPRLLIDGQNNHFSRFFKDDETAVFRDYYSKTVVKKIEGIYKYSNSWGEFMYNYNDKDKFKFYLFSDLISDIPECATNEDVFAVCKFREGGEFKHAIFNFHELSPVENQ